MSYGKGDESVVQRDEEDDGPYHHTTDEAEGPARSQDGVDLGDKDWAQCPRPTPWGCQPAHVHTLQTVNRILRSGLKHYTHCYFKNNTTVFIPEVWVQGFLNTVCRTSHCRLGIQPRWGSLMRCTVPGGWQEYTGTMSGHTGSLLAPKSCWKLSWLQKCDWPKSCFWGLYF